MKLCIFAVCHNSYQEALAFLDSITTSLKNTEVELDFYFIDNSTDIDEQCVDLLMHGSEYFNIYYHRSENLGYIPSISACIRNLELVLLDYEYVCISNVDLEMSDCFFKNLDAIQWCNTIGVYAPAIISSDLNVDRNPKIVSRPSRLKLVTNKMLFRYSLGHLILRGINSLRLKIRDYLKPSLAAFNSRSSMETVKIYAAHGSFMILTKAFVNEESELNYPVFLFGEEIYIAERAIALGQSVVYAPDLIVYDKEHVSTSLMRPASYRRANYDALTYILRNYKF